MIFSTATPDVVQLRLELAGQSVIAHTETSSRFGARDAQESLGTRLIRLATLAASLHAAREAEPGNQSDIVMGVQP